MGMWAHPRSHAPHLRLRHVATHWPWPKQLCGAEDVWSYCSLGVALDWALQQSCWLGRRRLAASGTRLILTPDCWDTKKDWEQRPHGSHGRRSCSGFWNGQNEILGFECSCRLKIKYVWLATYHLQLAKRQPLALFPQRSMWTLAIANIEKRHGQTLLVSRLRELLLSVQYIPVLEYPES